jgi:hypothetical protein
MMADQRSRSLAQWQREAVRQMRSSRRETLEFAAALPPRELRRPRTVDRWSAHDILAHLLACDEETERRFRLIARGQGERIHWFESMADADRFNARTVAALRRLGPAVLLRRLERARARLVDLFERLPVSALRDPAHAYPVVDWLPAPGWSHERDHLSEIKSWWERQAGAATAAPGGPPPRRGRGRSPSRRARARATSRPGRSSAPPARAGTPARRRREQRPRTGRSPRRA